MISRMSLKSDILIFLNKLNMRNLSLFVLTMMLVLSSCSNSQKESSERTDDSSTVDSLLVIGMEQIEDRVNSDPALKELRDGAAKLSGYIRLDGDRYILEISEDEAIKLGVRSEVYHYHLEEINKANEMIADMKARGDSISLMEF